MADYGNWKLNSEYTPADPSTSKMGGLMNTDYKQLKKDLQTPGDLQIKDTFDQADYTIRDNMGGQGMYGSSIYANAITNNANKRANALSSNAAYAGATTEQLRNQHNQWLGGMALDEAKMANTWNLSQNQMDKGLIHDVLMASLGNDYALRQIDAQGNWGLKNTNAQGDINENAALWTGVGGLLSSFF